MRGGERVLEALCRLFPEAPLFTLLHEPGSVSATIEAHRIVTSPLQRLPARVRRAYRTLLPLMPAAVRALQLPPCDLVISSSHCAIKAVRPPRGARHLCYIHTPMRYVWDQREAYFGRGRARLPTRLAAGLGTPALRAWDQPHRLPRGSVCRQLDGSCSSACRELMAARARSCLRRSTWSASRQRLLRALAGSISWSPPSHPTSAWRSRSKHFAGSVDLSRWSAEVRTPHVFGLSSAATSSTSATSRMPRLRGCTRSAGLS